MATKKRIRVILAISGAVLLVAVGAFLYLLRHPVRGSVFDSNGVAIHYTEKGEGVPVILIHGYGINSDLNWRFNGILRKLARTHRVIAMDMRGHGRSGKPHVSSAYGVEMVEDVVRLMDHLGIAKAHVVGYSMGGFVALKLLAGHPDRLISAIPCGAGWMVPGSGESRLLENVAVHLRDHGSVEPLVQMLRPEGERACFLHVFIEDAFLRFINDKQALIAVAQSFSQLAVPEGSLRANKVPVTLIIGERDPIKRGADALNGVLANHELVVIPGATHTSTLWRKALSDTIHKTLKKFPQSP